MLTNEQVNQIALGNYGDGWRRDLCLAYRTISAERDSYRTEADELRQYKAAFFESLKRACDLEKDYIVVRADACTLHAALAELASWREDGLLRVIDAMLTPVTLAVLLRATPPGAGEESNGS